MLGANRALVGPPGPYARRVGGARRTGRARPPAAWLLEPVRCYPLRMTKAARCPICESPVTPDHKPFCSKRCKTIDLGSWLGGDYAIPAVEPPNPEDLTPEELEALVGGFEA